MLLSSSYIHNAIYAPVQAVFVVFLVLGVGGSRILATFAHNPPKVPQCGLGLAYASDFQRTKLF